MEKNSLLLIESLLSELEMEQDKLRRENVLKSLALQKREKLQATIKNKIVYYEDSQIAEVVSTVLKDQIW